MKELTKDKVLTKEVIIATKDVGKIMYYLDNGFHLRYNQFGLIYNSHNVHIGHLVLF